jgi:hypothetical protein
MSHEHARPTRPLDWPVASRTPAQFEFDLLAEMARDPDNGLVEISPGVYKAHVVEACPFCRGNAASSRGYWNSGPC